MAQEICIPRLGWSMEEGVFVGWLKQDGDEVRAGEPLFELEGEKGLQEVESVDAGILRIPPTAPKEGSTLAVGAVLGYMVAAGEAAPWEVGGSDEGREKKNEVEKTQHSAAEPAAVQRNGENHRVASSPRARRVAAELGVEWREVAGTGNGGRVREADVRQLAARAMAVPPLSPRRKMIAARMLASSQQTAPVTLTTRCDVTNLVALRQQFKEAGGNVPSYSDIAIKLVALALRQQPQFGARWADGKLQLPTPDALDIGLAVDTEQGLVVPVVRDAGRKLLGEIAVESRRLVDEARTHRASAADLEGGVFTVTNLGPYGIDAFTPIINLPQVAILGLGAIRREPVVKTNDTIAVCEIMTLSLTFDHRALDGAPAAQFLQTLSSAFVNPVAWLLGLKSPRSQP